MGQGDWRGGGEGGVGGLGAAGAVGRALTQMGTSKALRTEQTRLGGVRQDPAGRARAGVGVPQPLHAPHSDQQRADSPHQWQPGGLHGAWRWRGRQTRCEADGAPGWPGSVGACVRVAQWVVCASRRCWRVLGACLGPPVHSCTGAGGRRDGLARCDKSVRWGQSGVGVNQALASGLAIK